MIEISPETVAQLLYLVHDDPEELEQALGELRPPDIAEALRELPPQAAAKVMAALPRTARSLPALRRVKW